MKRRAAAVHRQYGMPAAPGRQNLDPGGAFQNRNLCRINAGDQVNLSTVQGGQPGGRVEQRDNLDPVDMGATGLPILRVPVQRGPDAGLIVHNAIRATAIRRAQIQTPIDQRQDRQMIIGQQQWKIDISSGQGHNQVPAIGPQADDLIDQRFDGR